MSNTANARDSIVHSQALQPAPRDDADVKRDDVMQRRDSEAAIHLQSNDPREACYGLALAGGAASAVLGALFWRGWAATGREVDAVPCLVTVLMSGLLVHVLGRVRGGPFAAIAASFALIGMGLGKVLAWDVCNIIAGYAGHADAPEGVAWERIVSEWESLPGTVRAVNLVCYALTPLAASAALWFCGTIDSWGRRPDEPAMDVAGSMKATDPIRLRPIWRAVAAAWAVTLMAVFVAWGGGERCGFRLLTFPCEPLHAGNSLLGFSALLDRRPIMMESLPAIEQVGWFSGVVRSDNNFRFLRAGYSFVAAHAAPLLGPQKALLVVNVLSWAACLVIVWRLSLRLFRDEAAAAMAACFAAAGIGFAIHVHESGPHLPAFALYYLGVLVLVECRLGERPRPWRTHLTLGLSFALMSLVYNVAQMLLVVYLLIGWRKQRVSHLVGAAALALSARPVWRYVLPALGINVEDVEGAYFAAAWRAWAHLWSAGVLTFAGRASRYVLESATAVDSPVVLALGFGACVFVPRSGQQRRFGFAVLAAPVLACTVFAPAAETRGYVVYGMSIWLYCCLGGWLASGLRRRGLVAILARSVLVLGLAGQLAWSTGHLWGWLGPAKTYFLGWDNGWPAVVHAPTRVLSLTGQEPTPAAFGGNDTLAEAGAVETPPDQPVERVSRVLAWLARFPFFVGLAVLAAATAESRHQRRIAAGVLLLVLLAGSEWSVRTTRTMPEPLDIYRAVPIKGGEFIQYRVQVSSQVRDDLRSRAVSRRGRLGLHVTATGPLEVAWEAGGRVNPVTVSGSLFVASIDQEREWEALMHPVWTWTIRNPHVETVWLMGWQRRLRPGRELFRASEAAALPAIEVRVINSTDGFLEMAAF